MRHTMVALFTLFFGHVVAIAAPSVAFADAVHHEAGHCEFHIEKIQLIPGSYRSISASIYMKVALPHLDGEIKDIGFRAKSFVDNDDGNEDDTPWRNIQAERVNPFVHDQWKVTLLLEAGERLSVHEGVFYVLTTEGTWFWLHPMHDGGRNFVIDTKTFTINNELIWNELWVNDYEQLRGFNPNVCQ